MWKWLRWILIPIGIIVMMFSLYLFQPWVFLPHQKIQMSLPFAPEYDSATGFIPMGETIEHNASNGTPDGHPGFDFSWQKEINIIAVEDGIITSIKNEQGKYSVEEQMGFYRTVYKELNSVAQDLHFLSIVKKGQTIGQVGSSQDPSQKFSKGSKSHQMHWDFASSSMKIDRLCPTNYFDASSKARLEAIWANVPSDDIFKVQFPNICNGVYKNKEE